MKYRSDEPLDLRLRDDEPFFVVRAQDVLSVQTVIHYAQLLRACGLHDQAQDVEAVAVAFSEWQTGNMEYVKLPD